MRKEWKIEPLSLSKIEKYNKSGEEYKLISDNGTEVRIVSVGCGRDNNNIFVEETNGDNIGRKQSWYVTKSGKATYNGYPDVYIWVGHNFIEKGDLIKMYNSETGDFHFIGYFIQWSIKNSKDVQFIVSDEMDCYGGQFDICMLGHQLDNNHRVWVEPATEGEHDKYYEFALKNGYSYSEELCRWCDVPKVGTKYWFIEMENGRPYIVEHEAPKKEEERPKDHLLCFDYKKRAEAVLERIVEATKKVNL